MRSVMLSLNSDAVTADRPGVEETVETRDALHMRQFQPEGLGDMRQRLARQPAGDGLRFAQQLHQRARITSAAGDQAVELCRGVRHRNSR